MRTNGSHSYMSNELLHNLKVGEILFEDFLQEIERNQNALAQAIGVPSNQIYAIINGTSRIT